MATYTSVDSVRDALAKELCTWIRECGLTTEEVAAKLQTSRPRVSNLLNDRLDLFSIDSLVKYCWRAGKSIELTVLD